MRLKYFLGIIGLGTICLLAVVVTSPRQTTGLHESALGASSGPATAGESQSSKHVEPAQAAVPTDEAARSVIVAASKTSPRGETSSAADEAKHEAYVEARTAELMALARKSDAASLGTVLSEIRNPDREVRQAALDALSQSGNRSAIPALQQAAAQTENPDDKEAIHEVIEFLKLPTLTETLRQGQSPSR